MALGPRGRFRERRVPRGWCAAVPRRRSLHATPPLLPYQLTQLHDVLAKVVHARVNSHGLQAAGPATRRQRGWRGARQPHSAGLLDIG